MDGGTFAPVRRRKPQTRFDSQDAPRERIKAETTTTSDLSTKEYGWQMKHSAEGATGATHALRLDMPGAGASLVRDAEPDGNGSASPDGSPDLPRLPARTTRRGPR